MKKNTAMLRGIAAVTAFLLIICTTATTIMFPYAGIINSALNVSTTQIIQTDDTDAENAVVYDNEFGTDSSNNQEALALELAVAAENITQAQEGAVLLTNNNEALPLAEGVGVTIFGNGAYHSVGTSSSTPFEAITASTLTSALQEVLGESQVTSLEEEVYGTLGTTSSTEVVEAEISEVKSKEALWQNANNDAAIVVFSRQAGESQDTVMVSAEGRHYLGLSKNEEDLMKYLHEQKQNGVFGSIIVLINSENAMELGWLDTYEVDACMIIGRPGAVGYTGIVDVLTGAVSPSGRIVDTYAVNSLSAPAITYAGDNTQTWLNLDWVEANDPDYETIGSENNWIVYAEGIYVGYKYYETRYEDTVLGQGNASSAVGSTSGGNWNYNDEVAFTFGDGLSYTTFEQTLDDVSYDGATDSYQVTVTIKNTGSVKGMDVVEVYAQTPYGSYEKENQLEKAAIQFAGMGKTKELEPGESETLTVPVERYFLASYDTNGEKSYVLSQGDYYLAIGSSAHDALNNILSAKGYTTENGMDQNGNAAKVYQWTQDSMDTTSYQYAENDTEVTNQFDFADLNYYGIDFNYLSRSDWEGTYPEEAIGVELTEEMLEDMVPDWYTSDEYETGETFVFDEDSDISFADLHYIDYNDDETWNTFLNQLTLEEMLSLLGDNDGFEPIDSIGMPGAKRLDDNLGIGILSCTGTESLSWVSETTTARTWNTERFTERGRLLGIEAIFCDTNEVWYGGGNIHRTPFGGRNGQYYSEDGNFGYIVSSYEAEAMQDVGVIFCIKHMALNDQETARGGVAVFTNEQALREIYLRVIEGSIRKGGAMSVMTAFNRIGCIPNNANDALLNSVLRGEWGFVGHITSDGYSSLAYKGHFAEFLVTGQDYYCMDGGTFAAGIQKLIDNGDTAIIPYLRRAAKNNLYVNSRSMLVNGLTSGTVILEVVPVWQKAILICTGIFGIISIGCMGGFLILLSRKNKSIVKEESV